MESMGAAYENGFGRRGIRKAATYLRFGSRLRAVENSLWREARALGRV